MGARIKNFIINLSINRPRLIVSLMAVLTILTLATAALPTLFPKTFPNLHTLSVDTDPENMLSHSEPARVYHDKMKSVLNLNELIAIGVINKTHKSGVFNKDTLSRVYEMTEFAKTLNWENERGEIEGVVSVDIMSPSMIDSIEQVGRGVVKFEWLMKNAPKSDAEALEVMRKAKRLPFLEGAMFSKDNKSLAIMLPITSKNVSHEVYVKLQEKIKTFNGDDEFHIAGLPVAEDTFGVEMFKQMAISAPMSMLVIFILMYLFFKKVSFVVSPMIVAFVSVILTMGTLIISGNTVHIMSSMIPIFIMPIAVLDAVHILSDFFDTYQHTRDRKKTLEHVMDTLFAPMFYTSLTTMAGFSSLALTPNPPVQVFGTFVAVGVFMAWLWTILFIPAYIMLMSEKSLENFGASTSVEDSSKGFINKFLNFSSQITYSSAKKILSVVVVLIGLSIWGISKININDNPTRWFNKNHPIRVADREMNKHLAGTYMGYFALNLPEKMNSTLGLKENIQELNPPASALLILKSVKAASTSEFISEFENLIEEEIEESDSEELEEFLESFDTLKRRYQVFKSPEVLKYIEGLQNHLATVSSVGKTNSIVDIVKTVHRELFLSSEEYYTVPDSYNTIAQTLLTYQSSHRPQDLWHFVTPSYDVGNIWIQLKSGNNQDMEVVVSEVEKYLRNNPAPHNLEGKWFGLTYINLIWQSKMVKGMLESFLGSFVIVLIMMMILFRSVLWGILSMVPLTVTILMIYGAIGFIGKDYDMPVAVLSSLSLGLAVDYAIHFLSRSREIRGEKYTWKVAIVKIFKEPARAIVRNIFVVGVGFLPLLLSTLNPYKTVGSLIAMILILAGFATVLILPSLITVLENSLFKVKKEQINE